MNDWLTKCWLKGITGEPNVFTTISPASLNSIFNQDLKITSIAEP